ncbi:TPA: hypothetical protein CPT85_07045 [Candidatus Gastranaerophilales bacterium HUM_21]|jgi:lipoprotein|nr:MAG TPA: hypothetical protein CPT85_07045 [Candidatus Gastranaerophilales bacterium HUM_21]
MIKDSSLTNIKFENKFFFAGISLGSCSTNETGVAIIDKNLNIITLDKLFSMEDVRFFFKRMAGKQNAIINIALPENPTMLNAKWKLTSRQYQLVQSSELINQDSDWIQRYSHRGCDFFEELKNQGLDIFRYDIHELKSFLGLSGVYKDRSPVDCKALQSALKYRFGFKELPSNMLPVSQLEAILGAYLGIIMADTKTGYNCKIKSQYNNIEVIGLDL